MRNIESLIIAAIFAAAAIFPAWGEDEAPYRFSGGEKIQIELDPPGAGRVSDQVVSDEGKLSLPTGSTVNVKGKTLDEVKALVASRMMAETSFKDVKARVIVLEYPARRIYVAGEVRTPRSIVLTPGVPMYLLSALQEAGGITDQGDAMNVNLVHTDPEGKRTSSVIDVTKLARPGNPDLGPKLVAGDTVLVPRCAHFVINGEFNRIGLVSVGDLHLEPGEKPILSRVIAGLGGAKKEGDLKNLKIIRLEKGKRVVMLPFETGVGATDPELLNGDIVDLPTKPAQLVGRDGAPLQSVSIGGKGIRAPGIYPLGENGLKLSKLVIMAGGLAEFAKGSKVKINRPGSGVLQYVDVEAILKKGAWELDVELKDGDVVEVPERAF